LSQILRKHLLQIEEKRMSENYPVLIGSKALQVLGYFKDEDNGPRDIDLVCTLSKGQELSWHADAKIRPGIFVFNQREKDTGKTQNKKDKTNASTKKQHKKRIRSYRIALDHGSDEDSRDALSISDVDYEGKDVNALVMDFHIIGQGCSDGMLEMYSALQELHALKLCKVLTLQLKSDLSVDVLVPPIEWLYALYRGHVHRIPNVFTKKVSNIALWQKYMHRMLKIREQYGYKKLDTLMQTKKFNSEYVDVKEIGKVMRTIFEKEFNFVNEKLGDAPSLDNKGEDTFFEDNVKRYLSHDDLHNHVAIINRGLNAVPLFPRFIKDPKTSVMMDESLFRAATFEDQLQTIREEIIVLYLERKMLPAIVEHGDQMETMWEFDEVVCHFMTNLCGNGHSWLRNYCLDHYAILSDESTYPEQKMLDFANKFRKDGPISTDKDYADLLPKTIESIADLVKLQETFESHQGGGWHNYDFNESLLEIRKKQGDEEPFKPVVWAKPTTQEVKKGEDGIISNDGSEDESDNNDDYHTVKIEAEQISLEKVDSYENEIDLDRCYVTVNYDTWNATPELSDFFNRYFGEGRDLENDVVLTNGETFLYNVAKGVACYHDPGDTNLVTLYVIEIVGSTFGVHGLSVHISDSENGQTSISLDQDTSTTIQYESKERTVTYYKSTCDGGYDREKSLTYVASYGSTFPILEECFEILGRLSIGILTDDNSDDSSN
jgi:hypothetical protein